MSPLKGAHLGAPLHFLCSILNATRYKSNQGPEGYRTGRPRPRHFRLIYDRRRHGAILNRVAIKEVIL
jgi:hypothetical protein